MHHKIKSIIPNGKWKYINERREKLLLDFIDEQNHLAIQVHKANIMFRRSITAMFINISLVKIVALHMTLNPEDIMKGVCSKG